MTPREYVASQQARWPVPKVTADDVAHIAAAIGEKAGKSVEEFVRDYNETDYATWLLNILKPRLAPELAALFDAGTIAVGTLGKPEPDAHVTRVDEDSYAILFHTGLRDLIYRVTRIIATRTYTGSDSGPRDAAGLEETARLIAEVFWWSQEKGAVFGPDYPISQAQILAASLLTQEAAVFLLAHETGHIIDEQSAGALDHVAIPGDPADVAGMTLRQRDEYAADIIGLHLTMGFAGPSPPQATHVLYTYAGVELALRIYQALEDIGYEFKEHHPPASKRLLHIRTVMQSKCHPQEWDAISSIASAIDDLMSNVVKILQNPGEHERFYEQQAAAIVNDFHALLERCSTGVIPDYAIFYPEAAALFGRGYSHKMLEQVAEISARFFTELRSVAASGGATAPRHAIDMPTINKGKLLFGFIEGLKEPARSIFKRAFGPR